MKFIKPSVEIITEPDLFKRIEIAARTCYKSESKITDDSAQKMIPALIKRGHESPLEHSNILVSFGAYEYDAFADILHQYTVDTGLPHYIRTYTSWPYMRFCGGNLRAWRSLVKHFPDLTIIRHIFYDHPAFEDIHLQPVDVEENLNCHIYHGGQISDPQLNIVTARFICDRGVSHELVRHRVLSYCVDGDTVLYSSGANAKHWTVKQLYEWQNDPCRSGRIKLMNVRSCDEATGELVKNKIIRVIKTGVKNCYRLKTQSGRELTCTADHRILTPIGYVPLGELSVGDCVMSNGLPLLDNKEWIYNYYIVQNHTRKETADAIGCCEATLYKAFQRFGIKKPWSDRPNRRPGHGNKGMFSPESIQRLSELHKGENNAQYNHNIDELTDNGGRLRSRKSIDIERCAVCGVTDNLEVHHIDHNPKNYDPDNLEVLCAAHHHQRHGVTSSLAVFSDPIVSIDEVGERDVYDVEMAAPYHNFVANGIVVHNCQESTRYVNYQEGLVLVEPWWWPEQETSDTQFIRASCQAAEDAYCSLIASGASPQKARCVLPNMLKTEVVATGTVEQWQKLVLPLRLSKAAHPDIRRLMELFCEQLGWDPNDFRK